MKVFITGGAGYIGSHVVKALGEKGHDILVFDNLSTGHERAVLFGRFIRGDLEDTVFLNEILRDFMPDAVMHFAASIQVEESVRKPIVYYRNNFINTLNLLNVMMKNRVKYFVYSSSAAVYGIPKNNPVDESTPLHPINPYGASKVMVERVLEYLGRSKDFHYVSLRYFNVAGADPEGRIGQSYPRATNLITRALKVAKRELDCLLIYGTDYPTKDGTGIRDYIHVNDLAHAHVLVLNFIMEKGSTGVFNCGYGNGSSVREVVHTVKKVTGIDFRVIETERRPGDLSTMVADSNKLRSMMRWSPRYDNLEYIIKTAWEWEKQ